MTTFEELRWKKFPVLDDGHICLVDAMGDDSSIVEAARIAYGKGTRKISEDRDLIRFLYRHQHMTPFEMAEIKLRVRVPMDCWRQWIRHRTANVNEYSTRYSEAIDSQQKTDSGAWRIQSTTNKQGSGGYLEAWTRAENAGAHAAGTTARTPGEYLSGMEKDFHDQARKVYTERLHLGVAREQARKDLPLSTYTEAYWKCDLRNILHFLGLRMDSHAQQEIRAYATIIGEEIIAPLFPQTWDAFRDYVLDAVTLSRLDVEVIRECLLTGSTETAAAVFDEVAEQLIPNKRERAECRAKLEKLWIVGAEK